MASNRSAESARCVFLDRDGVINQAPPPGAYILSAAEFRLVPAVVDWIRLFNALDFLVIVITNQRGIALGLMTEDDLAAIHSKMLSELALQGARLDDIYYCPHGEGSCECRKPKPGMIYAARDKWNIDLARSLMLGDSGIDEQLARAAGVPFMKVKEGRLSPR